MSLPPSLRRATAAIAGMTVLAAGALAQTTPAPADAPAADKPWAPPQSISEWASGITYGAQVDAGIVGNPADPNNGKNFGQLFTDKANRLILNQALFTVERDIDPKATDYDLGFKLQLMYGSDARIVHSLGLFDHAIHDRNQIDIVEANMTLHTQWLTEGGIDIKAGIYPTPLGYEVIDPKGNPFYSHSYIFNYGLPFKHLGILTTTHATPWLDIYGGIDSGTNTTVGSGDNNDEPGGIFGLGLNLLGGDLTILALTHAGPENATRNTTFGNTANRWFNDAVITYKANPKLTLTTELNYVREEGFRAEGYGAAQYASYALSDAWTLNGRAEIWRDNTNFFVSTPVGNLDYVNFERGYNSNFYTSQGPTTYSEITIGATYKPQGLPAVIKTAMLRPEIRYDRSLSGPRPFNDGRDKGAVTLSLDAVVGF